jgi:hypothetical protein
MIVESASQDGSRDLQQPYAPAGKSMEPNRIAVCPGTVSAASNPLPVLENMSHGTHH